MLASLCQNCKRLSQGSLDLLFIEDGRVKEKFKIADKGTTLDTFKNCDYSLSLYAAKVKLGLVPKMCYD